MTLNPTSGVTGSDTSNTSVSKEEEEKKQTNSSPSSGSSQYETLDESTDSCKPVLSSSDDEEEMSQSSSTADEFSRKSSCSSRSVTPERARSRSPLGIKPFISAPTVDTLSNAVANFFSLCCCVFAFGVFLLGSYDYFKNVEENKCEMTFMYQVPQYVPVPVGSGMDEKYPMYKLYVYVEGEQAFDAVSHPNYRFKGIPVLYIPGNAGSHQQVRSLASVALWKYLDASTPFHFDFFTVSFNEEFSGLYGYTLQRQMEYTRQALTTIVNLYKDFHRVVLVGHSMGGVIAKAVAIDENEDGGAALSNLIYTFATPHASPVAIFDPELDIFYHGVKRNWTNRSTESNITLVSVAGGDRDFLVASKLTRWPFNTIHVKSTGIPGVWASTDHLCIVWCKQLVLTSVRSLYDLVEFQQRNKYYAITDKEDTRFSVLNYHFENRTSGKTFYGVTRRPNQITLSKNVNQAEVNSGIQCLLSGQRSSYFLFPVEFLQKNVTSSVNKDFTRLLVLTTNTKDKNWIMGCVELSPSGECVVADNLSHHGKITPHIRRRRKMAVLELPGIVEKYSHIVVKMDPHPFKTCVMLEAYDEKQRTQELGGVFQTSQQIFYNLTLTPYGFLSYLVAWKVEAAPANMSCPDSHNLLAQFNHGTFQESKFLKNESLIVRYHDWNVSSSHVTLFLEPSCNYTVKTTLAPVETAGQMFRLLFRLLPSFYTSVILMALYFQKDPTDWSSFHMILLSNAYHLSLLPGCLVAVLFHFIPTDWPLMMDKNEYSVALPIICYMIGYSLVLVVSTGTWYAIITGGTAIHSVILRVLSSRFGSWIPKIGSFRGFSSVTEHVTEAAFEISLTKFPLTLAILLLGLSFATCGSLGIAVALVLYLIKLFKIYEDLLEDLLKAKITNVQESLSPMNFHFCSFMLWLVVGVLNIPSLMHWTRSFSTEATPQWDLSMYLSLLLLPTVAVLWQDFVPRMEPSIWSVHRYAFYAMGMACVLWGTHRLYVTAFLITFVFLTMAICQMVSVMMSALTKAAQPGAGTSETQPSNERPAEAN